MSLKLLATKMKNSKEDFKIQEEMQIKKLLSMRAKFR